MPLIFGLDPWPSWLLKFEYPMCSQLLDPKNFLWATKIVILGCLACNCNINTNFCHSVQGFKLKCVHHCLDILPHITCRSPVESLEILSNVRRPPDYTDHDRLFDPIEFKSSTFQRPFHYLKRLDPNYRLADVTPNNPDKDKSLCLQILLRYIYSQTCIKRPLRGECKIGLLQQVVL